MYSNKRIKTVGIFIIGNINNAGDEILGNIVNALVKFGGVRTSLYQFIPSRREIFYNFSLVDAVLSKVVCTFAKFINVINLKYCIIDLSYKIMVTKYYKKTLKNIDYVICSVGMLKYSTQDHSYVFDILTREAEKQGIPVLINGVSIEKATGDDWRFKQLVRAVNRPCVKMITTRDGRDGVEELKRNYVINTSIIVDFVGDPALWIPDFYQIHLAEKKSEVIGIGLIRGEIYKDYGNNFSAQQLMDFYIDLITYLEKQQKKWVLFCNGMKSDYEFGICILDKMGLPKSKLLTCPKNAQELVNMIQSFKVVFAASLHACITSFALDVPFVGLLWDNKLRMFAKTMKITDAFCEIEELNGETVSRKLDYVLAHAYDIENRNFYKQRTKDFIHKFLQDNTKE